MHYLRQSQDTIKRNAIAKEKIPAPLLTTHYLEIEQRIQHSDVEGLV